MSHHDPDQQDDSNINLFRRRAQQVPLNATGALPSQEEVDAIAEAWPVPAESAPFLSDMDLVEFIATALVKAFISRYKSADGEGLFEGMDRYRRLEERMAQAAVQAGSIRTWWGHLCRTMQVPGAVGSPDPSLMRLLSVQSVVGQRVLATLGETLAPHLMMARLWDEQERAASDSYADSADMEATSGDTVVVDLDAESLTAGGETITVEVPHYSANSLRHELVREPSLWHMYNALDLEFDAPLASRTALFYNGGDLKGSPSSSSFWKVKRARKAYPVLALLGGCADDFMFGESDLRVHTWLRCKENNRALRHIGLESDTSAFDMIDRQTHARHSGRVEEGQMPFTFETLVPGCEIVARLNLSSYAQDLEKGALGAAVRQFQKMDGTLGGQPARGYGKVTVEVMEGHDLSGAIDDYEAYLSEHEKDLREGIMEGTYCTGSEVIS